MHAWGKSQEWWKINPYQMDLRTTRLFSVLSLSVRAIILKTQVSYMSIKFGLQ